MAGNVTTEETTDVLAAIEAQEEADREAETSRERGWVEYKCAACGHEETGSTIFVDQAPTYDPRVHCGTPMGKTWNRTGDPQPEKR